MDEYTLEDVEVKAKENPKTFKILPLAEREDLRVGDFAKLIFVQKTCHEQGERMWVEVVEVTDDHFHGLLANRPVAIDCVKFGDVVHFGANNVATIGKKDEMKRDTGSDDDNVGRSHKNSLCPDCSGTGFLRTGNGLLPDPCPCMKKKHGKKKK